MDIELQENIILNLKRLECLLSYVPWATLSENGQILGDLIFEIAKNIKIDIENL